MKESIITNEDINLLKEMKDNCLKASIYEDEKRLLKANAITKFLVEHEENKQLKEQLQQKEDIINKAKDCVEEFLCSEYYCSQGLELHDFCVKILEILDNKGE